MTIPTPYFSIIVPVFNRPEEVNELLESLVNQAFKNFEVLIVEDGSKNSCNEVVKAFEGKLLLTYYYKENSGPGDSRNYGSVKAHGQYLLFLDSDCFAPENYLNEIYKFLEINHIDAFGGPDMSHQNFTYIQKAISYSMTSFFTTGGIRGSVKSVEKFHPRSFNMGISKIAFFTVGGFSEMRFGEDIDLSIRLMGAGFKTALIPNAGVYHKRRTDFKKFFKQVFNSGIARINLYKRHPGSLKIFHFFPTVFVIGLIFILSISWYIPQLLWFIFAYTLLIFIDSLIKNNIIVAFYSVIASYTQLCGYGCGFLKASWKRIILKHPEFEAFKKNFYK